MDGFTFIERIRADPMLQLIPSILVTSRDAPEDRQRGRDVGAHGYIVKSEFDQGALLERSARWLGNDADPRARRRGLADRANASLRGARGRSGAARWWARPRMATRPSSSATRLRPDVVTMDMMLPVMSGLAATEYIMAHCPTPILVVSSSTNRGELFKTYEALAAGAVDVLEKPLGS